VGSGFNFFTNVIDKTPAAGSWQDIDCSANVPAGSTGVIVKIVNTGASAYRGEIRKNGSTDSFTLTLAADYQRYAFIGLDGSYILEAYIGNTAVKIYLIGYADENCAFFDNAVDKTPAVVGSWQDVDASADIPADATGVICLIHNTAITDYSAGIRKNGSTDVYPYGFIVANNRFIYQLCGVDASRLFEANIQNASVKIELLGYTKDPVTFFTNGVDESLATISAWTDIDLTADTDPIADGVILQLKNSSASVNYFGDVRKNGSTDDHSGDSRFALSECRGAAIGLDSEQILEGWINNIALDFYVIGYCKPTSGTKDVTDSGIGTETPSLIGHVSISTEAGAGVDASSLVGTIAIDDASISAIDIPSIGEGLPTLLGDWGAAVELTTIDKDGILYLYIFDFGAFKIRMGDAGSGLDILPDKGANIEEIGVGIELFDLNVSTLTSDIGIGTEAIVDLGLPVGETIAINASIPISETITSTDVMPELTTDNWISDAGVSSENVIMAEEGGNVVDAGTGVDVVTIGSEENKEFTDSGVGSDVLAEFNRVFSETGVSNDVLTEFDRTINESGIGEETQFHTEITSVIITRTIILEGTCTITLEGNKGSIILEANLGVVTLD
jgi:hypothetical protein